MFFERVGVLVDLERPHGDELSAAAHIALGHPLTVDLIALVPEPSARGPETVTVDVGLRRLTEARLREVENELHARSDVEVTTSVIIATERELAGVAHDREYDLVVVGPSHGRLAAGLDASVLLVR